MRYLISDCKIHYAHIDTYLQLFQKKKKEGKGKENGNTDSIIVEFPLESKSVCSEDFTFIISKTTNYEDNTNTIDLSYTQFLQTTIHLASFCEYLL